jgi:outer membrane protein
MHIRALTTTLLAIGLVAGSSGRASAQNRLSVAQAVAAATHGAPEIGAVRAAADEAGDRVPQARAGLLPRLELTESWQRGDQPVFVFGSLLAQRRFSEANFAVSTLNHPDPISNFRTALTVEQLVFDGGRVRAGVRAAELEHAIAQTNVRQTQNDLALAATRAYGQVLISSAGREAAEAAGASADEDARTAAARRDAGVGTEADALALQVHLAQMRERVIRVGADERIMRAELNKLMGVPLDRVFVLEDAPVRLEPSETLVTLEQQALATRPEAARARFGSDLRSVLKRSAGEAFLPQVVVQGAYEWNNATFAGGVPAWMVGAQARLNLFAGSADLAKRRESAHALIRAEAERTSAEAAIRLDVLIAVERLKASSARQEVGSAMVAQARESHRMIRDRYEAGLASVGDVLRASDALLEAEAQRIGAIVDAMVDRAVLDRAVGPIENNP